MLPCNAPRAGRIGYVVKRYPRFSETFIVNEILAHEAAGMELDIFALRPPADTHFQDIIARVRAGVTYLPGRPFSAGTLWDALHGAIAEDGWEALAEARGEDVLDVYQALLLARLARERGIEHLHAHFATSATSVARLAARFAGLTYSFTAHAKDIFHETVDPNDLRRKLREAAAVITVSDFNVAHLSATYGLDAARTQRIYNGLDLTRFPYSAPDQRSPLILGVGRLVEKKGFDVLIEACALLAARGCDFTCQIAGGGELEQQLQEQIERRGLAGRVSLLGPRPQAEIIDLLRRAAVFAAPCVTGSDGNQDGLPTVLIEAMALGTPCVSTDVTGIPELVRAGETGLMVGQHDAEGLARAIEQLLVDARLRERLATKARALVESEFDIHRNAAELRHIFHESRQLAGTGIRTGTGVTL